ncbi:hypothetical protein DAPPUDRAFT_238131 [Daphnia pulex]|uniref:Uncharacterized protein n=1 Tax=Daphnia pulex TaxID=6669 RepID=E9G6Q3_DAPPU|nr:hypothetical protein DAPPUDRAFT_238131 [Daphnia pulex]|eukprot:EFX85152.1 hypothetical protein DAPPUDRAFT_238131 [Daphnia pulex]
MATQWNSRFEASASHRNSKAMLVLDLQSYDLTDDLLPSATITVSSLRVLPPQYRHFLEFQVLPNVRRKIPVVVLVAALKLVERKTGQIGCIPFNNKANREYYDRIPSPHPLTTRVETSVALTLHSLSPYKSIERGRS